MRPERAHHVPSSRNEAALRKLLLRLDGSPYPAYKSLLGEWELDSDIKLAFNHIQGDPFAAPSNIQIVVPIKMPNIIYSDRAGIEAAEDWILRQIGTLLQCSRRGSGKSGLIQIYQPGPEVVERSSVRLLNKDYVLFRLQIGLPASGRRIRGQAAIQTLFNDLVPAVKKVHPNQLLLQHVQSVRRQRYIREALVPHNLIAFIENGSILPRKNGVSQTPLNDAIPFQAPSSLTVSLPTPWGMVHGLGFAKGITLIVGGGYHGKSTVLQALSRGHLDHVPGDGREGVVALSDTVKIRAEDGRYISGVDVSTFLSTLPGGRDTQCFHTEDASGSTSQAAAIIESVEAGACTLLMDEDTCATNLLVRDAQMRALIPECSEPITPLVDRIQQMSQLWNVSTIMVVGGIGAYLSVASQVIAMDHFVPRDVTGKAKAVSAPHSVYGLPLHPVCPRIPASKMWTIRKIQARDRRHISFDKRILDVSSVEQILDKSQASTIGQAIRFVYEELVNGSRDLSKILDALEAILDDEGIEALSPYPQPRGGLIRPRRFEVAAALSRYREFSIIAP